MDTYRHEYIGWKLGGQNFSKTNSYDIFDKYAIDNCHILLLQSFPCASKDEPTAREAHYIKTIKCVNKVMPMRTREEYRTDNNEIIEIKKREYKQALKGETVICECGRELMRDKKTRHLKTSVHL
jgi:hypothetical protein